MIHMVEVLVEVVEEFNIVFPMITIVLIVLFSLPVHINSTALTLCLV